MSREYHERVRIDHVRPETNNIVTFTLAVAADMPDARPGQFLMVWAPDLKEPYEISIEDKRRSFEKPFSLSANKPVEITFQRVGEFTERLFDMKAGDDVFIRGPYGRPFPIIVDNPAYLVGGGCGVAPLRFLYKELSSPTSKPTVLVGAKTFKGLLCKDDFDNEHFHVSTEDGSYGTQGLVTALFDEVEIKPGGAFYICGPEKMMVAAAERALQYTGAENISLCTERYMKCGRGLCGACELDGYRTCVDGPVFSYDQLRGGDFGRCKREKSGKRIEVI